MFNKVKYILLLGLLVWSLKIIPAQAAQHTLGSNIITPQGTVYTITTQNGQTVRAPYTSSGAFLSYSFNTWDSIVGTSPEDMALPVGNFIPPQDGKVICSDRGSDKGTCYLITNGQKAGFTSANVFTGLGYSFDNVTSGDVSFLPSTANISSTTMPHNLGTLVNKNGTIYLISNNGLIGLPDWSTLQSWGYSSTDIVPANSADDNLSVIGTLPGRQPQYLAPLTETQNPITTNPTPAPTPTPSPVTNPVQVSPTSLNFIATVGGPAPAIQYVSINPGSYTATWTAKYTGQNNQNVNANLGYNGAVGGIVNGTGSGNMSVYVPGPFTTAGTYNDSFVVISGGQTQTVYITLTVTKPTPVLSVNLSSAMASPTSLTSGTPGQRIASFQISANSSSAANINSITLDATRNSIGNNFQNLVVMVSRSQVGATQPVFAANGQYTFNFSSPLVIPAGGSAIVDVYLDVSSSVNSSNFNVGNQNLVSLNSLTGTWAIDNSVIPAITPIAGQTVTLTTSSSLQISPSSLSFSASVGENPPNLQYFYLTPVSSSNNSWTAEITSSSIPALYLRYGTTTSEMGQVMNGSGSATIQVGSAGPFTAGNYTGTITITSGGQTQNLTVSLVAH